jgi:hypothetical protein
VVYPTVDIQTKSGRQSRIKAQGERSSKGSLLPEEKLLIEKARKRVGVEAEPIPGII